MSFFFVKDLLAGCCVLQLVSIKRHRKVPVSVRWLHLALFIPLQGLLRDVHYRERLPQHVVLKLLNCLPVAANPRGDFMQALRFQKKDRWPRAMA